MEIKEILKSKLQEKGIEIDDKAEALVEAFSDVLESISKSSSSKHEPEKSELERQVYSNNPPPQYDYNLWNYIMAAQQQQMAQQAQRTGSPLEKWMNDPLLGDFVREAVNYMQNYQKEIQNLKQSLGMILSDYINRVKYYNDLWNREMFKSIYRDRYQKDKEKYKFLPELTQEDLVKVAQEHNINSWEGAYDAWLAGKVRENWDRYVRELEEEARRKAAATQPPETIVTGNKTPAATGSPKIEENLSWDDVFNKVLLPGLQKFQ
ncbi:MAG: hypothetical protein QXO44_02550 [Thermoplasmatales archaeon]